MRSNYKPLGEYIREVNKRDIHVAVDMLLGVSIQKKFIPSIANIIGTDMSTYKIIKRNQFAYGPVTSRNGDRISIALLDTFDEAIVSQSYTVFEVIDTTLLLPEYLMMWFRRPEFDRYARFKSHGSARETFDWEEMCKVGLPIPSIEKQREIVAEYNVLINRINLNNTLIEKLEDTAQALYKQWFVDFEFPDAEGNPYKSSGGEMVYCEELEKDVPKGWRNTSLQTLFDIQGGSQPPASEFIFNYAEGYIRFIQIRDYSSDNNVTFIPINNKNKICDVEDILVARYGASLGRICYGIKGSYNVALVKILPNKKEYIEFLRIYLKRSDFQNKLTGIGSGKSAREGFGKDELFEIKMVVPIDDTMIFINFQKITYQIFKTSMLLEIERKKNNDMKDLILAKMASVE